MATKTRTNKAAEPTKGPRSPLLEWIMAGLGLALVLAVLGVLGRAMMDGRDEVDVTLRVTETRLVGGRWTAVVEARNTGGAAAARLEIEGRVGEETAAFTLDYLPPRGRDTGVLVFSRPPGGGTALTVRPIGWTEP